MGAEVTAVRIESPSASAGQSDLQVGRDEPAGPVVAISSRGLRLVDLRPMAEQPAAWLDDVAQRIRFLQETGFPFSPVALTVMGGILRDPIFEGTPLPLVSPAGEAGISAEFRGRDVELEIEVDGAGITEVYALRPGISEWEGRMEDLPDGIEKWAWRLAQGSL